MNEPENILRENKDRFVLFPIDNREMWELYKKAETKFWAIDGFSFEKDMKDFEKLSSDEKEFIHFSIIIMQLRFSNDIQGLTTNFLSEVQYPEARCFLGYQNMMSNIHSETYSILAEQFIGKDISKENIFTEIISSDIYKEKNEWIAKNFHNEPSFAKRLVVYSIIQRIFYSSVFAGISKINLDTLPMISYFIYQEDESLFTDFAMTMYSSLKNKLSLKEVYDLVVQAVDIEIKMMNKFTEYYEKIGMEFYKLSDYIKYNANMVMGGLTNGIIYKVKEPQSKYLKWTPSYQWVDPNKIKENQLNRVFEILDDF